MNKSDNTGPMVTTPVGVMIYLIPKDGEPKPVLCTLFQEQEQQKLLLGRPFIDGMGRFFERLYVQPRGWSLGVVLNGHPELAARGMRGFRFSNCEPLSPRLAYTQGVVLLDQVACWYQDQDPWLELPEPRKQELMF